MRALAAESALHRPDSFSPSTIWWQGQHFFKNLRRDDDQAVGQLDKLGSDSVSVGGGDQHPYSEILGGPNRLGKIPIIDDQHCGGEDLPPGKPDQIQSQHGIDSFLSKRTVRLLRTGDKMPQPELDAGISPDRVQETSLAGVTRMGRVVLAVVPKRRRNLSPISSISDRPRNHSVITLPCGRKYFLCKERSTPTSTNPM